MRLPDARSFCYCFSVQKGAKIIAWFQLIFGLGLCMFCFNYIVEFILNYKHYRTADIVLFTILLSLSLYPIVQGTLLMVGIKKKKLWCLLAWMVLAFVVEFCVTSCVIFYVASILTYSKMWFWMTVAVYCNAIQIGISFYLIVVVATCRKELIRAISSSSALYVIGQVI